MSAPLLRVSDLRVDFMTGSGRARVLDQVNLTMAAGEIVGLVGESGSGKTTLARAVLGILPTNAARIEGGEIWFDGRNLLTSDPDVLARDVRGRLITFVPQDPFTSFNPVFTIGSQILEIMRWKSPLATVAESGFWRGYSRVRRRADRQRVLELLRVVQLPDPEAILDKYPHEVSGGQRQRLMIAMALMTEAKLIIADEPTTALDVTIQAQILKLLRRLAAERGVAVLFATHDLGAAHEICDRVVVMYAGQDVEAAPAAAFFRAPAHPYTASLLASLPSRERGIRGIPGEIPVLINPPPGCRFHPRCAKASAACNASRPPVTEHDKGHAVRCFHPNVAVKEASP
ncbi:MAG: ABC transporter ATP-binding protein [Hyphomicrobiaceae bacterium]